MKRHLLFYDDEPNQCETFARQLKRHLGPIDVLARGLPTPEEFADALGNSELVGVLLDYKFETVAGPRFAAGSLAAEVRAQRPEIPVALLSAVVTTQPDAEASARRTGDLYDLVLDKAEVSEDAKTASRKIRALVDGYAQVFQQRHRHEERLTEPAVRTLLGLASDEAGLASRAAGLARDDVALFARFVIKALLRLPGPLVDARHAAVALGVQPPPLRGEVPRELASALGSARYGGVFAGIERDARFWADRVPFCQPPQGAEPALCDACGGPAAYLCANCDRPFDGTHTLPAERMGVPAGFETCRLCGFCLDGEIPSDVIVSPAFREWVEDMVAETRQAQEAKREREEA